jgi:hypothetical protein
MTSRCSSVFTENCVTELNIDGVRTKYVLSIGEHRFQLHHLLTAVNECLNLPRWLQEPCLQPIGGPAMTTPPVRPMLDVEAYKRRARRIDKFSRKFFPLAFVIFNIVYWSIYCKLAGPSFQLPPDGDYSHATLPN